MSKQIVVAEGIFSKLYISLNDDTRNKLMLTPQADNPLAKIEDDMKRILKDFERAYFEMSQDEPAAPSPAEKGMGGQ